MSEQYLSTSRLGNVMRLIALGRQTGLLRVVRGQGSSQEEGEVQFVDGQVAMVTVGQLSGSAAFSVLQNWGESSYMFLDGVNRLQPYQTTGDNLAWGAPPNSGSLPPMGSGSFPTPGYPAAPPNYGNQYDHGSSQPGGGPPNTRPGTANEWSAYPPQEPTFPANNVSQHLSQRLQMGYVPRRLTNINPAEATSLDRRERQLLLLVDGRRTIIDLVRLTRRGDEEIRYILAHLIALGLVE